MTTVASKTTLKPHSRAVDDLRRDIASIINLLHLSHEAIICIDEAQNIVVFNDGAEKIFGYQSGEIIGNPLSALIPGRFQKEHHRHVQQFLGGNQRAKLMAQRAPITGLRKNGEEFTAHASISRFSYGGERTMTVVLHELEAHAHQA